MKLSFAKGLGVFICGAWLLTAGSDVPGETSFARFGLGRWSPDGMQFVFELGANLEGYHNLESSMVMVSFKPGSLFGGQLRNSNRTLAYYSSFRHQRGRAVVQINGPDERDRLASLAHEDVHACGAIEVLNPELTSTSLGDAVSPVIPTSVYSPTVDAVVSSVVAGNISSTVSSFEALGSRYHAGSSPNTTSDLVKSLWNSFLPTGATLTQTSHSSTAQKSVVLKIPGRDTTSKAVIIGAHMDTINYNNNNNAPGADDDASGIAAITEILRVIKSSNAQFSRPIEFHAYAAEEVGLLGSYDLAVAASSAGQSIAAMLQLDMIGYTPSQGKHTIHLVTTDTSPVLLRHMKDVLSGYLGGDWESGELHAGTSDHRSWYRTGVHTAFAFEDPNNYNRALHTEADKSDRLDFTLAARFAKLGLAFLAHEAGLTTAVAESDTTWAHQKATAAQVKLAIGKSSTGGYRLSAAVAESLNAQSAEVCKLASGNEYGCQSLVTSADFALTKSGRSFFVSDKDLTIAAGDIWRIHLYSATGGLLALRTVKLSQ